MALQAKNKMGFVDGSIKKPAEGSHEDMQQWGRCNVLVKTWLLSSIFKEILASVIYCELASQIWAELKERFSQANSMQLFHIKSEISDCVQGTMTVGSYFTKLKGLWDECNALLAIPACNCGAMKNVSDYMQI
ncbi:hypothetical protein ACFXTN_037973 [Malus domestica]